MCGQNEPPYFSVIVPTRNRAQLLQRLLVSLSRVEFDSFEVIVVDDGSTDGTRRIAESFDGVLSITYLYQRWGMMGAARNLGLERATGNVAAFTDDDCVVDPGWLRALWRGFDENPSAIGVQGKTVTRREEMTPFTRQVEQLQGGPPYRTCNIAYRVAVLKDLGGFDTRLIRGEDAVMGMRVLERGPIVFAPEAVVVHPPRLKEWADRAAWTTLLRSELHFRGTYPQYQSARSATLSLQRPEHAVVRWVVLPLRLYWRSHYVYARRHPLLYLRYVPSILREKLALFSLLPRFWFDWRRSVVRERD